MFFAKYFYFIIDSRNAPGPPAPAIQRTRIQDRMMPKMNAGEFLIAFAIVVEVFDCFVYYSKYTEFVKYLQTPYFLPLFKA
jgi:hypothetical protein